MSLSRYPPERPACTDAMSLFLAALPTTSSPHTRGRDVLAHHHRVALQRTRVAALAVSISRPHQRQYDTC